MINIVFLLYFIVNVDSNLIDNPGFEAPLEPSWYFRVDSGVMIAIDHTERSSGSSSLKIKNLGPGNRRYHACNQTIKFITQNRWYTLTSAIKTANVNGTVAIDIHFIDSIGNRLPKYDAKIAQWPRGESADWEIYSVDFYMPEKTDRITIALFLKGQGSVWFDALSLIMQQPRESKNGSPSRGAYLLTSDEPLIWFEFAEQKVYKNDPSPQGKSRSEVVIDVAKGEYESFQVVVRPKKKIEDCTIEFSEAVCVNGDIIGKEMFSTHAIGYVNVERTSIPDAILGFTPDILIPQNRFTFLPGVNNPIWISFKIPETITAGLYRAEMIIATKQRQYLKIPLNITVHDFVLPSKNHLYVKSNFWLSLIRKYDERSGAEILKDYYENLRNHRVNTFGIVPLKSEIIENTLVCSFDEFDNQVNNLFEDYGFEAVCVGPFMGDANGWKFRRKWLEIDPESPKFDYFLRQYCRQLEDHLSKKGWLNRCWITYWDEPQLDDPGLEQIVKIGRVIKETAPSLRIFMTVWPTQEFFDIVDIWCIRFFKPYFNPIKVRQRQKLGEKIFVYHNDPYIDTPLIDKRMYAWRYKLARVDGAYSWWNLTYWVQNPYEGQVVLEDGRHGIWDYPKAGDGILLYPNATGKGPPVNSMRWEIFHQGLEDYEYFWLLEKALGDVVSSLKPHAQFEDYPQQRIEEIIGIILRDYFRKDWRGDVKDVYDIRARITHEIVEARKPPLILIKTTPYAGDVVVSETVKVEGITEKGATVFINDKAIEVHRDGTFVTEVILTEENSLSIVVSQNNSEKIIRRYFREE